eukprot:2510798-Rhodomonas_salina.1
MGGGTETAANEEFSPKKIRVSQFRTAMFSIRFAPFAPLGPLPGHPVARNSHPFSAPCKIGETDCPSE